MICTWHISGFEYKSEELETYEGFTIYRNYWKEKSSRIGDYTYTTNFWYDDGRGVCSEESVEYTKLDDLKKAIRERTVKGNGCADCYTYEEAEEYGLFKNLNWIF